MLKRVIIFLLSIYVKFRIMKYKVIDIFYFWVGLYIPLFMLQKISEWKQFKLIEHNDTIYKIRSIHPNKSELRTLWFLRYFDHNSEQLYGYIQESQLQITYLTESEDRVDLDLNLLDNKYRKDIHEEYDDIIFNIIPFD